MKTSRKCSPFETDKRRKHHHWQVVVSYHDGETFARTYTDHEKAVHYAKRQKSSPVVKRTRVVQLS
jgi:hypothetical protein